MANELVLEDGVWKFRVKTEAASAAGVGLLAPALESENVLNIYSVSSDQKFSLPLTGSTIAAAGIFYLTGSTMITGSTS